MSFVRGIGFAAAAMLLVFGLTACSGAGKKSADESKENVAKEGDKKSATTKAGKATGDVVWSKECTVTGDTRTISVSKEGDGCMVSYIKFGSTSNPAQSRRGTEYCEEVATRIQNNLSNAGFDCK